jgi:hypothetical protein
MKNILKYCILTKRIIIIVQLSKEDFNKPGYVSEEGLAVVSSRCHPLVEFDKKYLFETEQEF